MPWRNIARNPEKVSPKFLGVVVSRTGGFGSNTIGHGVWYIVFGRFGSKPAPLSSTRMSPSTRCGHGLRGVSAGPMSPRLPLPAPQGSWVTTACIANLAPSHAHPFTQGMDGITEGAARRCVAPPRVGSPPVSVTTRRRLVPRGRANERADSARRPRPAPTAAAGSLTRVVLHLARSVTRSFSMVRWTLRRPQPLRSPGLGPSHGVVRLSARAAPGGPSRARMASARAARGTGAEWRRMGEQGKHYHSMSGNPCPSSARNAVGRG